MKSVEAVYSVFDKVEMEPSEYVVVLKDRSRFAHAFFNIQVLFAGIICLMQDEGIYQYHVRLVLKRWFKEELQDDLYFERLLETELLLSSISTSVETRALRRGPSIVLRRNVDALFASQSRIPKSSKRDTRRKRAYADIMATSKEAASLAAMDTEVYNDTTGALGNVPRHFKNQIGIEKV